LRPVGRLPLQLLHDGFREFLFQHGLVLSTSDRW
jgi:hypothetical protein